MANLWDILRIGSDDVNALSAPGRTPLSYARLRQLVEALAVDLRRRGLGRSDRVAVVLPNGPEMAVAFLAVATVAVAAPLNPSYTEKEFAFYLEDLDAKALLVIDGMPSPAIGVAESMGIQLIQAVPAPAGGAGQLTLSFPASPQAPDTRFDSAKDDDIALVLHTSGTTARPKIVPLTHRNICASACNVRTTLALSARDRGLNIMPLFHIHGLVAGLLAPLSAGGEVSCTPGFNALKFFDWMAEAQPSWYSAVPSMHQAVLTRAARHKDTIAGCPLRFIRSSSASLPPSVMRDMEETFGAPVVEAYGMTEAAHQMTSSPLPPLRRVPGKVGLPAGPDVKVVDEAGRFLPADEVGEIVIRGENVMNGYERNETANAQSFVAGDWFRTGDQGVFSADGYLSITGRLKEIINRAGEKISPREVDEAVVEHPAVAQCVSFAIPSTLFGEEVATAVVLREGESLDERELRKFLSERLAPFKLPSRIVALDALPKGPTGKTQRIGLAARLGLSA